MKKQYIKPLLEIEIFENDCNILSVSNPDPPASGVDNFIDEKPTGLDPSVTGGDYGTNPPEFIEGD